MGAQAFDGNHEFPAEFARAQQKNLRNESHGRPTPDQHAAGP